MGTRNIGVPLARSAPDRRLGGLQVAAGIRCSSAERARRIVPTGPDRGAALFAGTRPMARGFLRLRPTRKCREGRRRRVRDTKQTWGPDAGAVNQTPKGSGRVGVLGHSPPENLEGLVHMSLEQNAY